MKTSQSLGIMVAVLSALASSAGIAADKGRPDPGRSEYMNRCAVCHGASGRGDGGAIDILKTAPTDLTTLSKKNGGVFPFDRVYSVIDGRTVVKGHGSRDMPIWGSSLSTESAKADEYFSGVPYDMEMYVRMRIMALIDYLNRIQVK
jgi:mono/diheme cytochrome c family protein